MSKPLLETVVISLTTAAARRRLMSTMLAETPLSWSFFDAHRGLDAADLRYDPDAIKLTFGRTLGRQEIAVYSSQYAVITSFLETSSAEFLLVLEDDVLLDTAFPMEQFAVYCGSLGMDYIRVFGRHYAAAEKVGFFYDRNLIRYRTSPQGAQGFILTRRGARIMVEGLKSVSATIDVAMDSFWQLDLPVYGIFPYPAIERYSLSQIPVPEPDVLSARERRIWTGNRVLQKARKMSANVALRRADARVRAAAGHFRQIGLIQQSLPAAAE